MAAGFYDILRWSLGWKSTYVTKKFGGTWILDTRGTLWTLDSRSTNWTLDVRGTIISIGND